MTDFQLDTLTHPQPDGSHAFEFVLTNLGDTAMSEFSLGFTSISRTLSPTRTSNGQMLRRQANFHEYAPPDGFCLAPGDSWHFTESHLSRVPQHSNDGPKTAMLIPSNAPAFSIVTTDLQNAAYVTTSHGGGTVTGVLPQPAHMGITGHAARAPLHLLLIGGDPKQRAMTARIGALARRLFPLRPAPFVFAAVEGIPALRLEQDPSMTVDGYRIVFVDGDATLVHAGDEGLRHGLITLAQMLGAAWEEPAQFGMPAWGVIEDAPRHGWRGAHLDVSRRIYDLDQILRFLDIMAWHKLNRFHWHLTDDEGWRLEIHALPALTGDGAFAGLDRPVLPQLGFGSGDHGGFYTQEQVRQVLAHAAPLGIEVMPEIDLPGHCAAALAAYPQMADPDEPESYWSVQGYANNALNPAMDEAWSFTEIVLTEVCDLFPFAVIHIGGDEVDDRAWLASPQAQALIAREGLDGTHGLQAHYLARVHGFLRARGRITGGWEEAAHGGGIPAEGSLLFAWTLREKTAQLAAAGYDVIACPGQVYYLDMAQTDDWSEPGASWAGSAPVQATYTYEAQGDDPALAQRLKGVQACIWGEHLTDNARFNHQVFPRLSAIAEAGWTPQPAKEIQRFLAVANMMPRA